MESATRPRPHPFDAIGESVARRARGVADNVAGAIAFSWLTPNHLTLVGLILTIGVAVVIATGQLLVGGVLMIIVALFDMLDGALARVQARRSLFGAFLDSTIDRFSEAAILIGILWFEPTREMGVLTMLVLTGSLLVSYARARAEGLGIDCEVGILPRPQRVLILAAGLISGLLVPALALLAVLTHITVVQRVIHVRRTLCGAQPPSVNDTGRS
ncbi:MAG: CDP-alcohol phosphatidyltransferase family protein [Chloroflexi bacterium]|nr:CDP-alcohol phosphatidyltransferase family protein [Chloroflexota bacterium]